MTDVDDWDDDLGEPREEPDCFGCVDVGRRPRRILPGMTGCPDCNPTWWQHKRHLWKWRILGLLERLFPRRRIPAGSLDDEAPF